MTLKSVTEINKKPCNHLVVTILEGGGCFFFREKRYGIKKRKKSEENE